MLRLVGGLSGHHGAHLGASETRKRGGGMSANATPERSVRARTFIELTALENVLTNLLSGFEAIEGELVLNEVSWDLVVVDDGNGGNSVDLFSEFYPSSEDEEPFTVEQILLDAEQHALTARIFALLASERIHEFCALESARFAKAAEKSASEVRTMIGGDDVA
jgi:hypothetical protein